MAVAPFFCILFFVLPVVLFIGALILRAAVSLSNRSIGKPVELSEYVVEDEDDWSDYPVVGRDPGIVTEVIPLPGIGKGMWILFCILIVNAVVVFAIQMAIGSEPRQRRGQGFLDDAEFLARVASLPISFLLISGLLAAMLPTTFGRGLLVTFFNFVICLGIAAVLFVPLFLIRAWA